MRILTILATTGILAMNPAHAQSTDPVAALDSVVERLSSTTLYDLVPDEMIVDAIERGLSPADSRWLVFQREVCAPIIGNTDFFYEDRDDLFTGDCFDLAYAGYSAGDGTGESPVTWYSTWYYEKYTPFVEDSNRQALASTRALIMETARGFLSDPERLTGFYEAKRDVAIAALHALPEAEMREQAGRMSDSIVAMERFLDPDVQNAWSVFLQAETHHIELAMAGSDGSMAAWEIANGTELALMDAARLCTPTRCDVEALEALKFAGRRFEEGGIELVETWIALGQDFLERL